MAHNGTPQKKRAFLASYAVAGNVTVACEVVGVPRRTYYHWTEHDAAFSAALAVAREEAAERLEEAARKRAVEGVTRETGVYHNGRLIATEVEIKYSDILLIFLLKGLKPEKYRENVEHKHEVSGPGGGPIPTQVFDYNAALTAFAGRPVEDR